MTATVLLGSRTITVFESSTTPKKALFLSNITFMVKVSNVSWTNSVIIPKSDSLSITRAYVFKNPLSIDLIIFLFMGATGIDLFVTNGNIYYQWYYY